MFVYLFIYSLKFFRYRKPKKQSNTGVQLGHVNLRPGWPRVYTPPRGGMWINNRCSIPRDAHGGWLDEKQQRNFCFHPPSSN